MRALVSLVVLLLVVPALAWAEPLVRIAVAEGLSTVTIEAEQLRLRPLDGEDGYQQVEGKRLVLQGMGDGIRLPWGGQSAEVKVRADGPLDVAGTRIRGTVEVLATPQGLLVVNEIPMETYLAAVLGSEMMPSFHPEALKAQAVASRTYTIQRMLQSGDRPYHLGATVLSQVYGGVHREDPRTHAAVEATAGKVLVSGHEPIEAYFFSSCGGKTAEGGEALARPLPYLQSVPCMEPEDIPRARWTLELTAAELGRRLGLGALQGFEVVERSPTGRVLRVRLQDAKGTRLLSGADLRRRLGYAELRSLAFEVERSGGRYRFRGKGNGHGAGMCQWGAQTAANAGQSHEEILSHYYPGAELRQMY